MARLSTHVLDTVHGGAAAGVQVKLYAIEAESRRLITTVKTNEKGRAVLGEEMPSGVYELVFGVSVYFGQPGDPPFLNEVVVRFGLATETGDYHVPLLVSHYGYTTYRGT